MEITNRGRDFKSGQGLQIGTEHNNSYDIIIFSCKQKNHKKLKWNRPLSGRGKGKIQSKTIPYIWENYT